MGKTSDLFKKIRDIKGIFHTKMGTIKDRNGMGLTEVENITPHPVFWRRGRIIAWPFKENQWLIFK